MFTLFPSYMITCSSHHQNHTKNRHNGCWSTIQLGHTPTPEHAYTRLKQKEFLPPEIQRCDENTLRWTLLFVQGEGANKLIEDVSELLQKETVNMCYLCENGQILNSLRLISEITICSRYACIVGCICGVESIADRS